MSYFGSFRVKNWTLKELFYHSLLDNPLKTHGGNYKQYNYYQHFLDHQDLKKETSRFKYFWKPILFGKAILINTQPHGKTGHFNVTTKTKMFYNNTLVLV